MKINFIIPFIYRNGGIILIFEYANRLTARGHDVAVYCPIYPYNSYKGNFKFVYTLKRFYRELKRLYAFKEIRSKFGPINFKLVQVPFINNFFVRNAYIVIATAWPTSYSVFKLNENKGKKFYFSQDYEYWDSNLKYVDNSYRLPLKLITTCDYLKNLLLKKFNVDSTIVLNGIDFKKFCNDEKKFEIPRTILFIDNGLKRKNCEQAIQICIELNKKFQNLKFISFGHFKFHDLPDFIKFTSNPTDIQIKNLYSESDIFLWTSLEEGFSTPPAEAMACKCAVVTSVVGAIQEFSIHRETAIHVQPGDTDGFIKGVSYLLENVDEWKRLSLAGYEYSKSKLDCWEESTSKLEHLFKSSL